MKKELNHNLLQIPLNEFMSAIQVFRRKGVSLGRALLAFEGGFLSIESGEATVVMRATGEWHGRASFSRNILRALVMVPPELDPLTIAYADKHLLIGRMTISCKWFPTAKAEIRNLENPGLIDLMALEQTLPRAEMKGTTQGRVIQSAKEKTERRILKAAKALIDLEISEDEIRTLVAAKVAARLFSESTQ